MDRVEIEDNIRLAVSKGDADEQESIFDKVKDLSGINLNNIIFVCCKAYKRYGEYENCLSWLQRKGGDVNCKDEHGNTPLMICAKNGIADQISQLLKNGDQHTNTSFCIEIYFRMQKNFWIQNIFSIQN